MVDFNDKFFEEIGKSAGVTQMCRDVGQQVLALAQASAPVGEGDYRDGLHLVEKVVENRSVVLVVGDDWKTMLIEAKTGNLVRALNQVKRGG